MEFSVPNTASARAFESSVFPTPVGPKNRNDPIGLLGSLSPTLPRLMALATADTASSWPTTLLWRISSSFLKRSLSSSLSFFTGILVQLDITAAISSPVTKSSLSSLCSFISSSIFSICFLSLVCFFFIAPAFSYSSFLMASSFSFSKALSFSSASLRLGESEYTSSLIREAASSIRSIALSGRKRSLIYLVESLTAASKASSVMVTL